MVKIKQIKLFLNMIVYFKFGENVSKLIRSFSVSWRYDLKFYFNMDMMVVNFIINVFDLFMKDLI